MTGILPVYVLFLPKGAALLLLLHLFQQAGTQRKQDKPFVRKATYALLSLLLSGVLCLAALVCLSFQLKGRIGG
jgi:hypothetical protein